MKHREDLIAGRNAVIEALRAKKPIDKIFILDGCKDGPIRTIIREAKKQADYLVESDDITLRATKLAAEIKQDAETHARVMRMRTYDYVDKMLYDMQEKMDELNMKYFGEMYTNLEQTFTAINETLAANREEMKNLAYKTQNEVESGTFAPGEEEE